MPTYVEFYRPHNKHQPRVIGYELRSEALRFMEHKLSLGFEVRILDPWEVRASEDESPEDVK